MFITGCTVQEKQTCSRLLLVLCDAFGGSTNWVALDQQEVKGVANTNLNCIADFSAINNWLTVRCAA